MTKWIYLFLFSLCFLTACKKEVTREELLAKPELLRAEIFKCNAANARTTVMSRHCKMVTESAGKFMLLLDEQQAYPEKFGASVLKMQELKVRHCSSAVADKKKLMDLRAVSASKEVLKAAKKKHSTSEALCNDAGVKLTHMMAILKMGSPE